MVHWHLFNTYVWADHCTWKKSYIRLFLFSFFWVSQVYNPKYILCKHFFFFCTLAHALFFTRLLHETLTMDTKIKIKFAVLDKLCVYVCYYYKNYHILMRSRDAMRKKNAYAILTLCIKKKKQSARVTFTKNVNTYLSDNNTSSFWFSTIHVIAKRDQIFKINPRNCEKSSQRAWSFYRSILERIILCIILLRRVIWTRTFVLF